MNTTAPEMSGSDNRPEKVLVVEDEVLIRFHMAEVLREAGLVVAEASKAEEAIAALNCSTGIGIVLTDIRMPGAMDGIALAAWIRRERPLIKIVLVSANVDDFSGADVDAMFPKPVQTNLLIPRVRQLMNSAERSGLGGR